MANDKQFFFTIVQPIVIERVKNSFLFMLLLVAKVWSKLASFLSACNKRLFS